MSTPDPNDGKYRMIAWTIGALLGAALLVGGYLTSDQWIGLVIGMKP